MGDKGKKDKGKREEQKKGKQKLKEKRKQKKIKWNWFGQMEDKRKTKSQLIRELVELRQQVGELEASKIECDQAKTEFERAR